MVDGGEDKGNSFHHFLTKYFVMYSRKLKLNIVAFFLSADLARVEGRLRLDLRLRAPRGGEEFGGAHRFGAIDVRDGQWDGDDRRRWSGRQGGRLEQYGRGVLRQSGSGSSNFRWKIGWKLKIRVKIRENECVISEWACVCSREGGIRKFVGKISAEDRIYWWKLNVWVNRVSSNYRNTHIEKIGRLQCCDWKKNMWKLKIRLKIISWNRNARKLVDTWKFGWKSGGETDQPVNSSLVHDVLTSFVFLNCGMFISI